LIWSCSVSVFSIFSTLAPTADVEELCFAMFFVLVCEWWQSRFPKEVFKLGLLMLCQHVPLKLMGYQSTYLLDAALFSHTE
jgi:hypothetical protein